MNEQSLFLMKIACTSGLVAVVATASFVVCLMFDKMRIAFTLFLIAILSIIIIVVSSFGSIWTS